MIKTIEFEKERSINLKRETFLKESFYELDTALKEEI